MASDFQNRLDQAKAATNRFVRRMLWLAFILLVMAGIGYYLYSQMVYSDGYKSGQLVKISHRGVVIKTYEGSLNLSPSGMMTEWNFSVKNGDVARQLEGFDGKLVKLHYEQRYRVFFWQGDTDYIVDAVSAPSN